MIALLVGVVGIAIVWWFVRRLIVLALLIAALVGGSAWLSHAGSSAQRLSHSSQVKRLRHEVSHDVGIVLRHDRAASRRGTSGRSRSDR